MTGQVETVRSQKITRYSSLLIIKLYLFVSLRVSDKPIGETNPEDAKKDDQKVTEEEKLQIHKECPYVMIKALYTSITGMNATQNALSVTSNNIANAQTVGYKTKAMFDDLLYNNSIGAKGDDRYAGRTRKVLVTV